MRESPPVRAVFCLGVIAMPQRPYYTKHEARRKAFFEAFARLGTITQAADAVGVSFKAAKRWQREYPDEWAEAEERAADAIEREAIRRAVEGVDEPVFYRGDVVGNIKRYSDQLLIALLKMRGRYVERTKQELSGPDGSPIRSELVSRIAGMSDEELLRLAGEVAEDDES